MWKAKTMTRFTTSTMTNYKDGAWIVRATLLQGGLNSGVILIVNSNNLEKFLFVRLFQYKETTLLLSGFDDYIKGTTLY
jgi:hypothetical protein